MKIYLSLIKSVLFLFSGLVILPAFARDKIEIFRADPGAALSRNSDHAELRPLHISRNAIVYLKFNLTEVNYKLLSSRLDIPIRVKKSGTVMLKQTSADWTLKDLNWQNKPRTLSRNLAVVRVSDRDRKLSLNLKKIIKGPGAYSFGLFADRSSDLIVSSAKNVSKAKIVVSRAFPTPSPSPTATIIPTPIPKVSGFNVLRGPYLQRVSPTSLIIRWRTDVASSSAVYFGKSSNQPDLSGKLSENTTEHRIELSGLEPDTKYFYSVGNLTGTIQDPDAQQFFNTAPQTGNNKASRIWVLGDSGTADISAAKVRDAYINYSQGKTTDLLLMLGDNAYDSGTDQEFQAAVFNFYQPTLKNTVLWPTLGNHDGGSADSATLTGPYYDSFSLPRHAEAGGIASGTEAYYSFDYGQIHFVCLDSFDSDRSPASPMLQWLRNDLATTTASGKSRWIFAFFHHPPYSKGSHDSDVSTENKEVRENIVPILEDYGVDLVLAGHSHSYERSYLIDGHYGLSSSFNDSFKKSFSGGGPTNGGGYSKPLFSTHSGTIYAVAGSSGKLTWGPLNHPAMYTSQLLLGSMVFNVDGNNLDAKFISYLGEEKDVFSISKN